MLQPYYDIDFDGCMRPDHVPAMAGEADPNPGYSIMGNLFAFGYMKGIIDSIEQQITL